MDRDWRAAHRDARFLIVADDPHAPIARQIVEGVIDPNGEVEQFATIGFAATINTKSRHDMPERVRERCARSSPGCDRRGGER